MLRLRFIFPSIFLSSKRYSSSLLWIPDRILVGVEDPHGTRDSSEHPPGPFIDSFN